MCLDIATVHNEIIYLHAYLFFSLSLSATPSSTQMRPFFIFHFFFVFLRFSLQEHFLCADRLVATLVFCPTVICSSKAG
jgi:hypothetical protein